MPNATVDLVVVGYVSDPHGRGTISLLLSSILTLILCVWSALHFNVPPSNQTATRDALLSARWVIAGIYAPELVVFAAWRQWSSARLLQALVVEAKATRAGSAGPEWTMTHSFFACTGGFAFEFPGLEALSTSREEQESQAPRRLTLTARGMALLARCGHIPDVSRAEIEDKSKANDLAKAMVILQATWMLVQVLGRLAAGLPVTLVEVNTVAHVLCAFAMYLFWWHKPLLPREPLIIRDQSLLPLAAFMYSSSEMSGYVDPNKVQSQTIIKTLFAHLSHYSKTPELETLRLRSAQQASTAQDDSDDPKKPVVTVKGEVRGEIEHAPDSCLAQVQCQREKDKGTAFFERRPRVVSSPPEGAHLSSNDSRRWDCILRSLQHYPFLLEGRASLVHSLGDGIRCTHLKPEQLVASHIGNWPSDDLLRNVDGLVVGMVLWLANLCYGGIHAAAWNDYFPSEVEKWMWRSSAAYITFCGGLWVVLNFLVARFRRLNQFWEHWMDGKKPLWQSLLLGVVVFICGFSLVLARVFIVIEAFISIRQMPESAYRTPEWSDMIPHF
ncbi:hypothetical protein GGTG_08603 [Gaeumannomyces tritici R3-111a-1]|uniref:Uncharacterized protein n=1 Tax=Gaeumannomyces tritici (strain R3-111a-1) TaxID=644352 RepID=J3P517_GAET3|nr:hypothetical protein GGTG_08603 [Gaeumannomyces tritici R3-111a-1]EJT74765.1 hypothetical protein GGTG_08603 [Gaeumannomyces tritici R3-111a-1]